MGLKYLNLMLADPWADGCNYNMIIKKLWPKYAEKAMEKVRLIKVK